jgi:hypothetical protein
MKPKKIPMPSDGELIKKSSSERRVKKIPPEQWIWMGHPAHFIGGFDCRFHMATKVGDYIVSTVGEYLPDYETRELIANAKGIKLMGRGDDRRHFYLSKIGFEEIGFNRKYETMVFLAQKSKRNDACCPWVIADGCELEASSYNDAASATNGHFLMCEKVSAWMD